MGKEQRKSHRTGSQLFISFSTLSDMGAPTEGGMALALNISGTGILLENRNSLNVGIQLEMIVAVGEETIKLLGVVKHHKPSKDQFYIGVEFVRISDDELALLNKYYPDITD